MPYDIRWYWENKVLLQRAWGNCTLEDVHDLSYAAIAYFAQVEGEAHVIFDLSDITSHPTRLADLRKAVDAPANPHLGWLIFVSKNRLVIFLASALTQTLHPHLRSRWFGTLEEALVFLEGKIGAIPRRALP